MRRLILCTAGHVDHGKTALVRALTGIDCDTHPEEKRRGITINPGFAYLDLPAAVVGQPDDATPVRVGIVDVPGHQRFIRNMLAGACSVDFALLVVAVDDGVMPQTREHLALLGLLGIHHGVVCLSKTDLASPELLELAGEDVRQCLRGSCLEAAEVIPVSAQTGSGLSALRAAIGRVVARAADRPCAGPFRMYVDRVFSVAGFGTVVTGAVLGGRLQQDAEVFLLPAGTKAKVRRIERHGEQVPEIAAGERASLNLAGVERSGVRPGMSIADRLLPVTRRLDCQLTMIGERTRLAPTTRLLFYTGTEETSARVRLLDRDELGRGEVGLAQLELEQDAVLLPGDRFILRGASRDVTVGGGSCIDASPLHHRRRTEVVIEHLRQRATGGLVGAVVSEVDKRIWPASVDEIALALGCEPPEVREAVAAGRGLTVLEGAGGHTYLMGPGTRARMTANTRTALARYHREHPLATRGLLPEEIGNRLAAAPAIANAVAQLCLGDLVASGLATRTARGGFVLVRSEPRNLGRLREGAGLAARLIASAGMRVLSPAKLAYELAARCQLDAGAVKLVLEHLVDEGAVCAVDDGYVSAAIVERCRVQLLRHLRERRQGISVAEFRDLVQGNRRICLDLLAVYDREGTTRREGDLRVATDQGRALMAEGNRPRP